MTLIGPTPVHRAAAPSTIGPSLHAPFILDLPCGLNTKSFVAPRSDQLHGCFNEPDAILHCSIILSGACSMTTNGKSHHFQARDVILATLHQQTFSFENSDEFSALEIHVPGHFLKTMQLPVSEKIECQAVELQSKTFKVARELFLLSQNNATGAASCTAPEQLIRFGLATTLLGYALTHTSPKTATPPAYSPIPLEKVRQALLQRYDRAPAITDLAQMCQVSPTRLKQAFKKQFGCGPYSFYQIHRMEHASRLLHSNSVTETAMELGYSNISHFSAAFQKQFGCTPSQWQRTMGTKPDITS
ncbi:AraC family transcriptional regulator [Acetobacter cibinongensis]|uniref:AraC family transcriptional regulator n=1 Tax=Acetobacter cibinongensis TaxID=146475 RepID=A0A0D6N6B6_9PROT|nr:AraC family transcriptional regulator [Acetobacter cibinongensis]GAN61113.1 transcriptional regulator PchR [Acetobacter cibinongensis]GEL58391.1 AraC family transcriptional regulator [Acetobacter cibinongensis]